MQCAPCSNEPGVYAIALGDELTTKTTKCTSKKVWWFPFEYKNSGVLANNKPCHGAWITKHKYEIPHIYANKRYNSLSRGRWVFFRIFLNTNPRPISLLSLRNYSSLYLFSTSSKLWISLWNLQMRWIHLHKDQKQVLSKFDNS